MELTDQELGTYVLSDWRQLTAVLQHGLPVALCRRLLALELAREPVPRLVVAQRLRGALARAWSVESTVELELIVEEITAGRKKLPHATAVRMLVGVGVELLEAERLARRFSRDEAEDRVP